MFGGNVFEERDQYLEALAEKLNEARARYEKVAQKNEEREGADFYLVVVFKNETDLDHFLTQHSLPNNRYQER